MPHTTLLSWEFHGYLLNNLMKFFSEIPNYPLITEHYFVPSK